MVRTNFSKSFKNFNSLLFGKAMLGILFTLVITNCNSQSSQVDKAFGGGLGNTTIVNGTGGITTPSLTFSPSTLNAFNFGNVATNAISNQVFTISNNTSVSAIIQTATVSGTGFSIIYDSCSSTILGSGGNCTITGQFAPASTGPSSWSAV